MKKYTGYILWAWVKEFILTLILYGLLMLYLGSEKISNIIYSNCETIIIIAAIVSAVSVAILIYYLSLDSEFGKYLTWRKIDNWFLRAFQFQTIMPFLTACCSLTLLFIKSNVLSHVILILFLYTCINGVTVIQNICDLYRLKQKFRFEYDLLNQNNKNG